MIIIAEFISFIFHPVLFFLSMPFLVVYKQTFNTAYAIKWELFSAVFVTAGVLFVFFGKRKGLFSDYDLSKKEERHVFYLVLALMGLLYLGLSLLFKGLFFPLSIITLGIVVGIIIFEIIDFYFKASVHIGVSTAWVITMGVLYGFDTFLAICWIVPLMLWARITLKKHTVKEAMLGCLIGIIITLCTYYVGKYVIL